MGRFADEWTECRVARSRAEWERRRVGRGALRGDRYVRTAPGFYRATTINSATGESATQRILDAKAAMPVLLPPGHHRADTAGISYRQCTTRAWGEVVEDVPVTTLLRTALDLARLAPDVTEAVVALDAFLGARRLKPETLRRAVERMHGTRGVRQARQAVDLARVGVRSTWESRLRLFAVLELGLTELEPNRAVFDTAGNLLGIPDLLDAESGLVLEYDGATWRSGRAKGHRDREQHREDNVREEGFERAGLIVVRAEKRDLTRHRRRLRERIGAAHADGLARDRSRDRWTLDEPDGWYGLPA